MQSRIDTWAKKGGKKDKLWESVKHAEKREGVVVKIEPSMLCLDVSMDEDAKPIKPSTFSHLKPSVPTKHKTDRDKDRLLESLDKLATMQNDIRKAIQIIQWRERLLSLAVDRAESTSQCGWDQRLCFGDEDWEEELGKSILKSYESGDDADRMDVDHEEWWCNGESVCSRHVGYVLPLKPRHVMLTYF
jgi:COMPASS component SPP1